MRRSYTFSYLLLGDLAIAVGVGLVGVGGLVSWVAGLPLIAALMAAVAAGFLVRAHHAYLVSRSGMTPAECVISAAAGAFIPALFWVLLAGVLGALGAEFLDG